MRHTDDMTIAALRLENQRLRRLVEILHDSFCPADCEEFAQQEQEVTRVFFLTPEKQDAYWYNEARGALGMPSSRTAAPSWNTMQTETNHAFQMRTKRGSVQH
ncbi:MAG: hypothetical protein H7039_20925 [Bryobacteraceae bacterium]|nr:hypothetical protein [Bryobacteraceae bacterium]